METYLFIAALLLSANAVANITVSGEVVRIYPHGSAVHFKLKNDPCGSASQYYYFTLSSDIEKAWFALLLAAANTSKPVDGF